jgi:hypothetical protein
MSMYLYPWIPCTRCHAPAMSPKGWCAPCRRTETAQAEERQG